MGSHLMYQAFYRDLPLQVGIKQQNILIRYFSVPGILNEITSFYWQA